MKTPIAIITIILFCISASAQNLITLQNGINLSLYSTLDSAIINANDGDQIFLPGGVILLDDVNINKSVLIFGAGHYPDSSLATGISLLTGNLYLVTGASGGLITGCRIDGDIIIGNGTPGSDSVSNYTIQQCTMNNLSLSFAGIPPTNAHGFLVNSNVINGSMYCANANSINAIQNIICKSVQYLNGNSTFSNNDFIGGGNCVDMLNFLFNVSSCMFQNNIIIYSDPVCTGSGFFGGTCNGNVFTNNLFKDSALLFPQGSNTAFNSITNQPDSSIFVNGSLNIFNYASDYHLDSLSPGINAGTDGYDIGIYGTNQPYKDGGIPFNPHIQQKSIGTSTDNQGYLNIQIRAAAQDY